MGSDSLSVFYNIRLLRVNPALVFQELVVVNRDITEAFKLYFVTIWIDVFLHQILRW